MKFYNIKTSFISPEVFKVRAKKIVIRLMIFILSLNKIGSKFVSKLLNYRIVFKDMLTFLGFDYRVALLITLCLIVIGMSISKIR